jgi:methyl-accepting chemotaxis protein-1 (serine sensor receptor)
MNKFLISTRLFALLGALSILLLLGGAMGVFGLAKSNDGLRSVYEDRTICLGQLDEINRLSLANDGLISRIFINYNPEKTARLLEQTEQNSAQVSKVWQAYASTHLSPEEGELARDYAEARLRYRKEGLDPLREELKKGNLEDAKALYAGMAALYDVVKTKGDTLLKLQLSEAKKEYEANTARYHLIRAVAVGGVLAGVAISITFGWLLITGIQRSLRYAAGISRSIAAGDLTVEIKVDGKDEVSQLLGTMDEMKRALVQVVSEVRTGVDAVSAASGQIAAGNQDLSSRTEEQASSLEQTAASMEELTTTVKQTADNARQVNQLANSASEAASSGGIVVTQVVSTMGEISAASTKIAEIINVIDGIAFQTNLLALNAAVEAARAGEQGRGFSVVASEVRNLAQRSAQAAREIKSVIEDSVAKVEVGSCQANEAVASMSEIVKQVRRVNDLISGITSAATDQSAGIDQINEAVAQMDQMTQQNAALVEESAAAAASMQQQAVNLSAVVSVFKIGAGLAPTDIPAHPVEPPTAALRPRASLRVFAQP